MRHSKVLFTFWGAVGVLLLPALLEGQAVPQTEIDLHFRQQLTVRDELRKVDSDIKGLEDKLAFTILTGSDRANQVSLLNDDRNKRRGYKAAFDDGISYLRAHWDQLTNDQRQEVEAEEFSIE